MQKEANTFYYFRNFADGLMTSQPDKGGTRWHNLKLSNQFALRGK